MEDLAQKQRLKLTGSPRTHLPHLGLDLMVNTTWSPDFHKSAGKCDWPGPEHSRAVLCGCTAMFSAMSIPLWAFKKCYEPPCQHGWWMGMAKVTESQHPIIIKQLGLGGTLKPIQFHTLLWADCSSHQFRLPRTPSSLVTMKSPWSLLSPRLSPWACKNLLHSDFTLQPKNGPA